MTVTDLKAEAAARPETWSPKIVAEVNGAMVKVARLEGQFVWHDHAGEDEAFLVLKGSLRIEYEDRPAVTLNPGDLHVVPRGVRHNPVADEECLIALIEPASTAHTGAEVTPLTRSLEEQRTGSISPRDGGRAPR
ncbi:cupin domain-containing protein [Parvularcula dongshanensis]|uniref:Quercetin dioxygenase-like cupin family protein n=1 Tax=Parvularcula dongshanensis TaxID=1173995 RepID=A0A840I274_9PROT|nr:cupin domain-containing protein [Parvularcula dongshanensis]MBB4658383.1 quercetin dioxygenase-like cupin family protein [Parvularcula dongshanensis]